MNRHLTGTRFAGAGSETSAKLGKLFGDPVGPIALGEAFCPFPVALSLEFLSFAVSVALERVLKVGHLCRQGSDLPIETYGFWNWTAIRLLRPFGLRTIFD